MLALKYLLFVTAVGMFAVAAAILGWDYYAELRYRRAQAAGAAGLVEPEPVRWRTTLALALLAWAPMLIALSIVVVPSGMAGVRVSQGTPAWLRPGPDADQRLGACPNPSPAYGRAAGVTQVKQGYDCETGDGRLRGIRRVHRPAATWRRRGYRTEGIRKRTTLPSSTRRAPSRRKCRPRHKTRIALQRRRTSEARQSRR